MEKKYPKTFKEFKLMLESKELSFKDYDVYNIAYKYLLNKYGYSEKEMLDKHEVAIRKAPNKKAKDEILKSLTDDDYTYNLKEVPTKNNNDYTLYNLLQQYNKDLGYTVKKELFNKLVEMKIIK